ncbi:glycosyltransferase family 4 protein [Aliikangiella sp. IMCC44632]
MEEKLNITIFVDDYLPSSTKVAAKMLHELGIEYSAQGCKVTVVTPSHHIKESLEINEIDGIEVVYFKAGNVKHPNKAIRAINELSLSFRARKSARKYFDNNYSDLIIYYSPSIFFANLVEMLKKKWNCPSYLILRDIFPQWAVEQGIIKKDGLVHKLFTYFELKNYKAATAIGLQSPKNKALFDARFSGRFKTDVLYNWASKASISPKLPISDFRRVHRLENKIIYFYGGNIGSAQDMMNLVRLAKNMRSEEIAHFVLLGSGDEVSLVESALVEFNLTNVTLLPPVSQDEYLKILADIDVGVFCLSKKHTSHNFPGKILSYMQMNKAILGSVNEGNDVIELFDSYNAGLIAINGYDEEFYLNAKKLLALDERQLLASNAVKILENEFSVSSAASKIIDTVALE